MGFEHVCEPVLVSRLHFLGHPGKPVVLRGVKPPKPPAFQVGHRALAVVHQVTADVVFAPAALDEQLGEVGRDDQDVGAPVEVIGGNGVGHGIKHQLRAGRSLAVDLVGAGVGRHGGDRALIPVKSQHHMERVPRCFLILGDAIMAAARVSELAALYAVGAGFGAVPKQQADGPGHGAAGPVAGGAEQVHPAVEAQLPAQGAVHDQHGPGAAQGGHVVELEVRVADGLNRGHQHGHVFLLAPGHDGIDG